MPKVELDGLEANFLLFALDRYCGVNQEGKLLSRSRRGYSLEQVQALRDKLFAAHEHPEEERT